MTDNVNETFDFDRLADDMIQLGLEQSTSTNYQIQFDEVGRLAGKDEAWVIENIERIRDALVGHNDNELLEYPYDVKNEDNEKVIDLNYCSLEDDEMSLFRKENGRWIRKSDNEVALYHDVVNRLSDVDGVSVTDIKIYHPEDYGFEKDEKVHVLVEYEGKAREDNLFNILFEEDAEDPLIIEGHGVDFNPINIEKSGSVEDYLSRLEKERNADSYTNEILDKIRAAGINVEISAERIQEILTLRKDISKMTVDIQEFEEKRKEIENIRNYIPLISDENKSLVREQEFIDFQTSLIACKKFIDDLPGKKLPNIKFTAQNNRGEEVNIDLIVQKNDDHLVLTTPSNTLIYDFDTKVAESNFIFEAFKDYNATNNCCDILVKTINDNLGKQLGEQRSKLKKLMQENAVLSGKALNELSEEETKELKEKLKELDYEQVEGILVHKDKKIALTPEDYVKEVMNAKLLVDHNHTVYLLPENFAFRKKNEFGQNESYSTPDTLTDEEFVELKTTDSKIGTRFGEAVEQANSVLIRIQDDISLRNVRRRLQNKINNLSKEKNIDVKDGKLFLYFEKKGKYIEAEIKQGKINILPAGPELADFSVVPPAKDIISQAEELSSSIPKVNKMMARSGLYWNGKPYEYTMAQYALNSTLDMKWLNHFFGTTSSDIHQFTDQMLQPQVAQEMLQELLKTAESMDYTGDAVSHKSKIGKERLRTFEMFAEQIRNGNIGYYDRSAPLSTGAPNWTTVNGSEVIDEPEYMFKNGFVAGLAYDNNIILHPDYLSSNAAVHEYTHLWDAYTQKTNPELWNKGLELFKDTKYWNEVISDPNYQDIKDDENLVLSEIHSRICGDIAEKVLDRIAELDGEQTKLDAVDWNKETWNYISEVMMKKGNVTYEHGISSKDLQEFLAMPMKDLMEGKNINVENELQFKPIEDPADYVEQLMKEGNAEQLRDYEETFPELSENMNERIDNGEIFGRKEGESAKPEAFVKDLSKVIVFDTETTGFKAGDDELLQVSIIDGTGKKLFNSYVKPEKKTEWKGAMMVNHISPRMVAKSPSIKELAPEIQKIIDGADMLISYNGRFDVNFLEAAGIKAEGKPHLDVIKPAASITKFPPKSRNDKKVADGFHYPKLTDVAKAIGFSYKAHDSLGDTTATLEVAKNIYGKNLENLTAADIEKYTIDEKKPARTGKKIADDSVEVQSDTNSENNPENFLITKGVDKEEFFEKFNLVEESRKKIVYDYLEQKESMALNDLFNSAVMLPEDKSMTIGDMIDSIQNNERAEIDVGELAPDSLKDAVLKDNGPSQDSMEQEQNGVTVENSTVDSDEFTTGETKVGEEQVEEDPARRIFEEFVAHSYEAGTDVPDFGLFNSSTGHMTVATGWQFKTMMDDDQTVVLEKLLKDRNGKLITNEGEPLTEKLEISRGEYEKIIENTGKFIKEPQLTEEVVREYEKVMNLDEKKQRPINAENFTHNVRAFCRSDANNPNEAIRFVQDMLREMKELDRKNGTNETEKVKEMMRQWEEKSGKNFAEKIIFDYNTATDDLKINSVSPFSSQTLRPIVENTEVISKEGALIDSRSNLKVGDSIKIKLAVEDCFGKKLHNPPMQNLIIVSHSPESNSIVLVDESRQSKYVLPRDTFIDKAVAVERKLDKQNARELKKQKARDEAETITM